MNELILPLAAEISEAPQVSDNSDLRLMVNV